jgi:SNF family Na+-dependent transporter
LPHACQNKINTKKIAANELVQDRGKGLPAKSVPPNVAAMSCERWSSRLGVILAVAGSAVGLGNFLRFPGQAAQYGGGAFMIAYFVSLLILGLPICWAEWTMGRMAGRHGFHSSPGVFHFFLRNRWGKYVGVIGVVVPVVIYMYYVVIESWCLGYAVNFLTGGIRFDSVDGASEFFGRFIGIEENGLSLGFGFDQVGSYLLFVFVLNFVLIYRGVSKGIEWFCKWAMPALLVLALVILARVLTLGAPDPSLPERNVINGLGYMWNPGKVFLEKNGEAGWTRERELIGDTEIEQARVEAAADPSLRVETVGIAGQLRKPQLWLAAAGQIFFSLSVGFGVILTYASYLSKRDDVVLSGLSATSANEFCEVGLGGLITLPAGFAFLGVAGVAGMGTFALGFNVLPLVFSKMPMGELFGFVFFLLLFLAAVTSSLSMLQPGIAFLEEALNIGRKESVAILGFITAMGSAFVVYFSKDLKALDTLDFWVGTFLIFILATSQIIVFSWRFGVEKGLAEAAQGSVFGIPRVFVPVMKFISPLFLLTVFALWMLTNVFGISFSGGEPEFSGYVRDLFIDPEPVAILAVGLVGLFALFVALLASRARSFRHQKGGNP